MSNGITLYRSNNVQYLGMVYAELIRQHDDPDPFNKMDTVIGTPAMGKWLEQQILDACGIAAHHRFLFPRDALFERLRLLLRSHSSSWDDPWAPDHLCWTISSVLEARLSSDDFAPLREHLCSVAGQSPFGSRDWMQLVLKLTHLFDNYLWYRPKWILSWESGDNLGALPAQQWQPILWRAICASIQHTHPNALHFPRLLERAKSARPIAMPPLYLFGVTRFPPALLTALTALSGSCAIHLFVLNPSNQYWADLNSILHKGSKLNQLNEKALQLLYTETLMGQEHCHPLLQLWGGQGRTNLYLMESLLDGHQKAVHDLFADTSMEQRALQRAQGGQSALSMLKQDLCSLTPPPTDPAQRQPLILGDDSIQLHNCHNLNRQLETLKDTLYRLFDKYPALEPRDVLVLSPRYEEVARLVPAVFVDSQSTEQPSIPYNRIDVPLNAMNPIAEALLDLLQLVHSRLDHLSVMAFLAKPVLRARFKLSPEHIEQLKGWILEAHIRWGADASDREHNQQPRFEEYTWAQGLEKMVLGLAMTTENDRPFGLTPLDTIEGGDGHTLLRGVEGIQSILSLARLCRAPCSSREWRSRLQLIIDGLMTTEHAWQQRVVLAKLEDALPDSDADLWTSEAINVLLSERFTAQKSERALQQNAITFGSLHPERNLPYKVIALIGMDDGVFPGSRHREAIDLMHQQPLPGDPHRAHENRYLLLEELLCAEEHLLVFYTGRNERTNKNVPAAPPIQELKGVLKQTFVSEESGDVLRPFERVHPLHPFGAQAFQPALHPELVSYERSMCPVSNEKVLDEPCATAPPPTTQSLSLTEICRFLRHPIRYRHQKVHSLKLSAWTDAIEIREPFTEDNGLSRDMALEIVKGLSQGAQEREIQQQLLSTFALPLGAPSAKIVDECYSTVHNNYQNKVNAKKNPIAIPELPQARSRHTLQFEGLPALSFSLPPITSTMIFFHCAYSKEQAQQLAWFEYCCGVAAGLLTNQQAISLSLYDDGKLNSAPIKLPFDGSQEVAKGLIQHQLRIYLKGMNGELLAFPKAGQYLVKKASDSGWSREELLDPPADRSEDYQKLMDLISKKWRAYGDGSRGSGDLDCPHIQFQFPSPPAIELADRLDPTFVNDSLDIWGAPVGIPVAVK